MKSSLKLNKKAIAIAVAVVATGAIAATLMRLDPSVVVSTSDPGNSAFKAKMGWISYKTDTDPSKTKYDVQAQIMVYADGAFDSQNIYVARSVDNGATWAQQPLTTSGGASTGLVTDPVSRQSGTFTMTHNKPNIYVAPIGVLNAGKGANALITWTASDCQGSAAQRINNNLIPLTGAAQPYACLWAARSVDGGVTWETSRLTDGFMDADGDLPTGYVKYTSDIAGGGGFAIAYQADPAGLQLGDAEGPGDGASGAKVSPGTNIWYTFITKSGFEAGTAFPTAVQVSTNTGTATGDPGASRVNLGMSGANAVIAYEQTKPGGGAKEIIYHSFTYNTAVAAGTVVSNPTHNARRVRFVLQGNEAFGDANANGDAADGDTKGVHTLLIWRDSLSTEPASPANIVMRRGIKNTAIDPLSTGFRVADLDTEVDLTGNSQTTNALAHRVVLRADFAAMAYDFTPDKAAADLFANTYNMFLTRSTDGGVTWSTPKNISNITDNTIRVTEPRLVGTPGTIKLPAGNATTDLSDIQNRNVLLLGWGTETNAADSKPLDIYITRTTDLGLNYERVQLLAEGVTEQSETQLRSPPDGKTLGALWMQHDVAANTVDVIYRNGSQTTVPDPDLNLTASATSFTTDAQGQVTFTILNKGVGDAKNVVLSGSMPDGLTLVGVSGAGLCVINGSAFTCTVPELPASQSRALVFTMGSSAGGTYDLTALVAGDVVDGDITDNTTSAVVAFTDTTAPGSGGGCSTAIGAAPFDPVLPALAVLGLIALGLRRVHEA